MIDVVIAIATFLIAQLPVLVLTWTDSNKNES